MNLFNNETILKILKVNFDKQQASKTHLISFWDVGIPDMIVSTVTINGIDPDYDFPRLCDSAGTIFLFQYAEVNRTEMSGMCFKVQLTFTKYFDQCSSQVVKRTTDEKFGNALQTSLTVVVCCIIICFVLIYIFIATNRVLKLGFKSDAEIKRISISKARIYDNGSLKAAENLSDCGRSRIFPISINSGSVDMINKFSKHTVSANSSFCGSIG
ncbi:unnamed protein product [Litomosoides sigmodontis]|uniref:C2 domain-containing protein n=1 Tax=Litomosoides sigmodontis TaxID=42156 RepID=A0A3P6SG45_LITSI|nr:unnamed protein product [Litomosoides sigmodontis]